MSQIQFHRTLSRRGFLKLLVAANVTAAGGYVLSEYTPWLDRESQVKHIVRPSVKESRMVAQMQERIRYATLAAKGHNTQPWKFGIRENMIEIHPDHARRLPVVDPHHRELWISLGCALENLLIVAHAKVMLRK